MQRKPKYLAMASAISLSIMTVSSALAADDDIAKQLSNPLASLISVPFQLNNDSGYGSQDGSQTTLNIQPVIPFALTDDLNLITRTIIPYKWQDDVSGKSGTNQGFGDTIMSFWFSPANSANGVTWGVGPVLYLPTSSDSALGVGEWGGGFTGVVLAQPGKWTIGGLANHIWSSEGNVINSTYVQPFLAYAAPNAWTFSLNTESTYDWNQEQWTVPVNLMVSKLVTIGSQRVSLQAGARYYFDSPDTGPEGWGARLSATLVFPKK